MILDKNKELIFKHTKSNNYNSEELSVYKVGKSFNICLTTTAYPSGEKNLMVSLSQDELKRFIDEVGIVIL